ncbi:MAG: ATP-binding protein [Elusimicrobiales bacterium]|nr:ATP-binding protein [Elusimicrobiales bacterium]
MAKLIPDKAKMTAVGRLAGGVAHDMNNILGAIEGYASLMGTTLKQDDPMKQDLEEIRKAVVRATALTRQLFAFGLRYPAQTRSSDAAAAVETLKKDAAALAARGITLTVDAAPGLPPVTGDQAQLELALAHLLSNARDAMPSGGSVTVTLRQAPPAADGARFVEISVTDTGTGITPETMQYLFEPFFTTKERGRGAGLGLPTVYGMAKQRGGWVEAESEPGRGARFSVFLPEAPHKT